MDVKFIIMKIALLTQGTRGDVEPFVHLGKELKRCGHEVTVSAPICFDKYIRENGLCSAPILVDVYEFLNTPQGQKMLKVNLITVFKNLENFVFPHVKDSLNQYYQLCQSNDKVFYHTKTLCDYFSSAFPGKMVRAMLVPGVVPTRFFANPVLSGFSCLNSFPRLTYFIQNIGLFLLRKPVTEFLRSKNLSQTSQSYIDSLPFVYAISECLLTKPTDYPINSYFTGFWRNNSITTTLSPELENFLSKGTSPLLVTFGSMVHQDMTRCLKLIYEICKSRNERLILVRGWNKSLTAPVSDSVFVVDTVPYDALFGRVKAVIHHGGIGTVASCLYAGVPMLVLPIMYPVGDQMFWGNLIWKKGLGAKPLPLKNVTKALLTTRINDLLDSSVIRSNCKEVSRKISTENGNLFVVDLLEKEKL